MLVRLGPSSPVDRHGYADHHPAMTHGPHRIDALPPWPELGATRPATSGLSPHQPSQL